MIFKKNFNKKILQNIHSQQKKSVRLISVLENILNEKVTFPSSSFLNIFNSQRESHSHIIDELVSGNSNNELYDLTRNYSNLCIIFFTFYNFSANRFKKNTLLMNFLENTREILEIYDSVIFHILEHPNLARENFGKKDIFFEKIYNILSTNTHLESASNFEDLFSNIMIILNNIESSLKKIIY